MDTNTTTPFTSSTETPVSAPNARPDQVPAEAGKSLKRTFPYSATPAAQEKPKSPTSVKISSSLLSEASPKPSPASSSSSEDAVEPVEATETSSEKKSLEEIDAEIEKVTSQKEGLDAELLKLEAQCLSYENLTKDSDLDEAERARFSKRVADIREKISAKKTRKVALEETLVNLHTDLKNARDRAARAFVVDEDALQNVVAEDFGLVRPNGAVAPALPQTLLQQLRAICAHIRGEKTYESLNSMSASALRAAVRNIAASVANVFTRTDDDLKTLTKSVLTWEIACFCKSYAKARLGVTTTAVADLKDKGKKVKKLLAFGDELTETVSENRVKFWVPAWVLYSALRRHSITCSNTKISGVLDMGDFIPTPTGKKSADPSKKAPKNPFQNYVKRIPSFFTLAIVMAVCDVPNVKVILASEKTQGSQCDMKHRVKFYVDNSIYSPSNFQTHLSLKKVTEDEDAEQVSSSSSSDEEPPAKVRNLSDGESSDDDMDEEEE